MANRYEQFRGITQVRNSFTRKMSRLFGRQAGRLVREIRATSDGKNLPDLSGVDSRSLFQKIQEEYKEIVRIQATKVYKEAAIAHGMPKDLANQLAREYAAERSDEAARQLSGSAFDRFVNLAERLDKRIDQDKETSYRELRAEVKKVFNPVRGENVAINETTLAASEGAQRGVEEIGLASRKDKWKTNPHLSATGPCPICSPLNGKTRVVWERRGFPNGPPAHIRCVCSIDFANKRKIAAFVRRLRRAA